MNDRPPVPAPPPRAIGLPAALPQGQPDQDQPDQVQPNQDQPDQPDLAALVSGLDDLAERPVAEHHDRLVAVHDVLHATLHGGLPQHGTPAPARPH